MRIEKLSSISNADSDEQIGEFWDAHDFTDFDKDAPDAEFEIISNHHAGSVKCNSPGQRPGIRFPPEHPRPEGAK